jgi:UPF0271 protein
MTSQDVGRPERRAGRIDLNADLGEDVGDDGALLEIVTSANIATGAHAGGGAVLARAVRAAARAGVAIGAHPSYRDRAGFGRASHLAVLHGDLSARSHLVGDLVAQVLGVAREADRQGVPLTHVKAHGSLYNEAVRDPVAAQVVADAVLGVAHALGYRVAVVTQPGGELAALASGMGLTVLREGFADRAYLSTGHLVGRSEPGAVLGDVGSMVAQALDLAGGHVTPIDGPRIGLAIDSLCVHGDTPGAVAAARAIRDALRALGWAVVAPRGGPAGPESAHGDTAPGSAARWVGSTVAGGSDDSDASPHVDARHADPVAICAFGDRALLVEPGDAPPPLTPWVLRVAARARRLWPTVTVVPGLASVLVAFDRPSQRPDLRDALDALASAAAHPEGGASAVAPAAPRPFPPRTGCGKVRHFPDRGIYLCA